MKNKTIAEEWDLRMARQAAEALIALQKQKSPIEFSYFSTNIKQLCTAFSGDNISMLARQLQIHYSSIQKWLIGNQLPSFSSLTRLSVVFGVPVIDWLDKMIDFSSISCQPICQAKVKNSLKRCDLRAVRTKLQEFVISNEFPPTSLTKICRAMGAEPSFVARKLPDLAKPLIERRKQYLSIRKEVRIRFTRLLVESTFNSLLIEGVHPSTTQMAKFLPPGLKLRDRDALAEFYRLRAELIKKLPENPRCLALSLFKELNWKHKMAETSLEP